MRRFIIGLIALAALTIIFASNGIANGRPTFRYTDPQSSGSIRLIDEPCADPDILRHVPTVIGKQMKRGEVHVGDGTGEVIPVCFIIDQDGDVLFVTKNGPARGWIPFSVFKRETSI